MAYRSCGRILFYGMHIPVLNVLVLLVTVKLSETSIAPGVCAITPQVLSMSLG